MLTPIILALEKGEAGDLAALGHPGLYSECKNRLDYMTSCLRRQKRKSFDIMNLNFVHFLHLISQMEKQTQKNKVACPGASSQSEHQTVLFIPRCTPCPPRCMCASNEEPRGVGPGGPQGWQLESQPPSSRNSRSPGREGRFIVSHFSDPRKPQCLTRVFWGEKGPSVLRFSCESS